MIWRCRFDSSTTSKSIDAERANSRGGQVQQRRRAEAAGADTEHLRVLQPLLPGHPHVRDDQMARVAPDLIDGQLCGRLDQRWQRGHRGLPLFSSIRSLNEHGGQGIPPPEMSSAASTTYHMKQIPPPGQDTPLPDALGIRAARVVPASAPPFDDDRPPRQGTGPTSARPGGAGADEDQVAVDPSGSRTRYRRSLTPSCRHRTKSGPSHRRAGLASSPRPSPRRWLAPGQRGNSCRGRPSEPAGA